MKLTIDIELGNAAFDPDYHVEVRRILEKLANGRLPTEEDHPVVLMDINGAKVGEARLAEGPDQIFVVVHGEAFIPEAFGNKVEAEEFAEKDDTDYFSGPWTVNCKR